jgi:tetratricopeptide (TPR) repeat protein
MRIRARKRERLHERAADVLAAAGAPAIEVANHLLAAKLADRAVPYCLQAAKAAERSHAHADAAELYERALPHVRDRSESARLLVALGQESILSGQAARAERYLERAVAELAGAGAVELLPSARLLLGRAHWERGRPDLARSEYEKAREALEAAGPSRELATAYFRLGQLSSFEFDHAAVLEMSRRAIDMAGEVGDDVTRIWARLYLATTEWQEGRADAAIAICDETRREAEAHDLPWIAYNALYNSIIPAANSLRLKEAESRARLLQQAPPSTFPSYHVGFAAGLVLRAQGRAAEAAQQQSEAIAACQEVGATTFLSRSESELAVCLAMLGRLDEARRLLAGPVTSTVLDQRTRQRASLRVALEAGDEQGMEWLRTHIDAVLASERLFPYDMLDRQVAALLWLGRIALARAHVDRAARPEGGRVWSLRAEERSSCRRSHRRRQPR